MVALDQAQKERDEAQKERDLSQHQRDIAVEKLVACDETLRMGHATNDVLVQRALDAQKALHAAREAGDDVLRYYQGQVREARAVVDFAIETCLAAQLPGLAGLVRRRATWLSTDSTATQTEADS